MNTPPRKYLAIAIAKTFLALININMNAQCTRPLSHTGHGVHVVMTNVHNCKQTSNVVVRFNLQFLILW